METGANEPAEGDAFSDERRLLLDRIAALEAQTNWAHAQATQIETLRKLGSWDVEVATGALSWSDGTYRIFGLVPGEPVTIDQALSFYPEDARAAIAAGLDAAIATGTLYDLTVPFLNASGKGGWVRTIGQFQDIGGLQRIVGVIEDVTTEKENQNQLQDLVFRDILTGLPNRRAFEARLADVERGAERQTNVALFLIDIDNFKSVNDRFGHPAGDLLLREIGTRLENCTRSADMVARLGGDEFGVLLYDVSDPDLLEQKAAQFLQAVRHELVLDDGTLHPTASIGVSHPLLAANGGALIECADIALYQAKAAGRDKAEIFRGKLRRRADRDARTLLAVEEALENDRFVVFYQPIVDLRTSQVRGLEALVRWNHPERGILPPADFAAALVDPRLSVLIDDFVLQQALLQMRQWVDDGVPVAAVNVNASEAQLRRPDLVKRVAQLLAQNRLAPERLKVELVETAFLGRDPQQIAATIEGLAEFGVACVLDDFGTGHASLTHLRQFRVERIKIDRSFVANICSNAFDRGLTKSLIDLGRNLGIRITAEGVETAEQLALLRSFGCDCAQGYLIGRPVPAQSVPELITNWYRSEAAAPPPQREVSVGGARAFGA